MNTDTLEDDNRTMSIPEIDITVVKLYKRFFKTK